MDLRALVLALERILRVNLYSLKEPLWRPAGGRQHILISATFDSASWIDT